MTQSLLPQLARRHVGSTPILERRRAVERRVLFHPAYRRLNRPNHLERVIGGRSYEKGADCERKDEYARSGLPAAGIA